MLNTPSKRKLNKKDLLKYFQNNTPNKSQVGIEFEKIGVLNTSNFAVDYLKIKYLLEKLSEFENYQRIFNNEQKENLIGLKNDYSSITLEPGSQFELSLAPQNELKVLENTDVKTTAIVNDEFRNVIGDFNPSSVSGTIKLDSYKPNELIYSFNSSKDELVVFSEIWTNKGWTLWIDGKESPLIRADYILRAAVIPAGNHEIMMRYEPKIWKVGNTIQLISSLILILGLIAAIVMTMKSEKCIMKNE